MKRLIPFIWLFIIGCKPSLPHIPSDIMSVEKMKMIMADIHIADAVAETKAQGGVNEKNLTAEYYAAVFKNNGTTREDFLKSYRFYEDNPVLMNKLYDSVLIEISRREAAVGKK